MSLTQNEIESIATQVAKRLQGKCLCGLSEEAREEMPHLLGVVKDIGSGDYQRGVEVVRDMGKRYNRMTKVSDRVGNVLTYLVLAAMFGGALYVVKTGVIAVIKAIKP